MTGGWAATNTLRDHLRGNGYLPQHEPMTALALVETALDAADVVASDLGHTLACEFDPCTCGVDALAAALRAVREGK